MKSIGLIFLRSICAMLALFHIFTIIWFFGTWAKEFDISVLVITISLILCALFPITGPGAIINRVVCPLASIALLISSIYSYATTNKLELETNSGNGEKVFKILLAIIALIYLYLTTKIEKKQYK